MSRPIFVRMDSLTTVDTQGARPRLEAFMIALRIQRIYAIGPRGQSKSAMTEYVHNVFTIRLRVGGWDPAYSSSPMNWPFGFLLLVH